MSDIQLGSSLKIIHLRGVPERAILEDLINDDESSLSHSFLGEPIVFSAIASFGTTAASITAGDITYSKVGATTNWQPVVAFDGTTTDTVEWVTGVGFSGVATASQFTEFVTVDEDNGDVFLFLSVVPNGGGTSAITLSVHDTNGVEVDTAETFNNNSGGTGGHYECFLAKWDKEGTPQFIKRLTNIQTKAVTNASAGQPYVWSADHPDYLVGILRCPEGTGSTNVTHVYGPGDAGEQTYTTRRYRRHWAAMVLNKSDGTIADVSVMDCNDNFATFFEQGTQLLSHRKLINPVTNRVLLPCNNSNFNMNPVLDNNGTATAVKQPALTGFNYLSAYIDMDLSVSGVLSLNNQQSAAAANSANDYSPLAAGLDDGKVIWGSTIAGGASPARFTNEGGATESISTPRDDQTTISMYSSTGTRLWTKVLGKDIGPSAFFFPASHLDDIENDLIYINGYFSNASGNTFVFGDGETNETSYTPPSNSQHGAIMCMDRTTGDLQWVTINEIVTQPRRMIGPLRLYNDEIRMLWGAEDEGTFDVLNAGGTTVDHGVDQKVALARFNASTGVFLGSEVILDVGTAAGLFRIYDMVGSV